MLLYAKEDKVTEFSSILRQKIEILLKKLEACEIAYSKHCYLLQNYALVFESELEGEMDSDLRARLDHFLKRSKWQRRKKKDSV